MARWRLVPSTALDDLGDGHPSEGLRGNGLDKIDETRKRHDLV